MNPVNTEDTVSRCSCGGSLIWEARETFRGLRVLALCSEPDCGLITTQPTGEGNLQAFLLGDVPPRRYLQPWVRLYHRIAASGLSWVPHSKACTACEGELISELRLPPMVERPSDPYQVVLCLQCGRTSASWWIDGERIVLSMDNDAWNDPSLSLRVLKQVLRERTEEPNERLPWPFQ